MDIVFGPNPASGKIMLSNIRPDIFTIIRPDTGLLELIFVN